MGTGMPFIFVSLSTISLSTIEKENMTSASGLFNLAQQVGGNIGYAVMATILDRNTQIHHAYLADHISQFNINFVHFYHQTVGFFYRQGMSLGEAKEATMVMANNLVTQQAAMMAYNDISIFLMVMFLLCIPFVLLIPVPKGRLETPVTVDM
jgi:DHA2 family multidrug resistance protein